MIVLGTGLHSGRAARVSLARRDGPVTMCGVDLREYTVVATDHATTIAAGASHVATVEHLLAAVAGLGIRSGLAIDVEGPELPIVDGRASAWCEALAGLELNEGAPALSVVRAATIEVGVSRYSFAPGDAVNVSAFLDVSDPRLEREASWDGHAADFVRRIAPARTFAFVDQIETLLARGLASHVAPENVVVITPERIFSAGEPFTADEPVRHKLLDLIGDLYVHGGPPRGSVKAHRPGHAATHEAMRRAVRERIVLRAA